MKSKKFRHTHCLEEYTIDDIYIVIDDSDKSKIMKYVIKRKVWFCYILKNWSIKRSYDSMIRLYLESFRDTFQIWLSISRSNFISKFTYFFFSRKKIGYDSSSIYNLSEIHLLILDVILRSSSIHLDEFLKKKWNHEKTCIIIRFQISWWFFLSFFNFFLSSRNKSVRWITCLSVIDMRIRDHICSGRL